MSSIREFHEYSSDILTLIKSSADASLANFANDSLRKSLLLAIASSFERKLSDIVKEFAEKSSNNAGISHIISNRMIIRQYHSWFDWNCSNANKFFSTFGPDFKNHMGRIEKEDDLLASSIKSFMELGERRNYLVHNDYASFALEKTPEELYESFQKANYFVEKFRTELLAFFGLADKNE